MRSLQNIVLKCSLLILTVLTLKVNGQLKSNISSISILNADGNTPFWMYTGSGANVIQTTNTFTDYLRGDVSYSYLSEDRSFVINTGVSASTYNTKKGIDAFIDEYYISSSYKIFKMTLGAKLDSIMYHGLSSTNGNMLMSNNARPYPMLKFSTNGFISFPFNFASQWFDWYAEYGEGLLDDNRFVDGTHIHQKKLHFRIKIPSILSFEVGLDDYLQWGGFSPVYGQLDESFDCYIRAVLGKPGSKDGIDFEGNALGNHLGQHVFRLSHKKKNKYSFESYYLHIFEDGSGKDFRNFPDGTWGLSFMKDKRALFTGVVLEYVTTKDQSGRVHDPLNGKYGQDNYFNNGIYKSGWTYHGRTIGTPFMVPRNDIENDYAFESTRFDSYYIGLMGDVSEKLSWKLRASYLIHYRLYYEDDPTSHEKFPEYPKHQQSYGLELKYLQSDRLTFDLNLGLDRGEVVGDNLGLLFGIKYRIK